jgi:hypothetical protein
MQRRARIKAVANLSAARRAVNKASGENQQEIVEKKEIEEQNVSELSKQAVNSDETTDSVIKGEESSSSVIDNDGGDVNKCDKISENLNERSSEGENKHQNATTSESVEDPSPFASSGIKQERFKAPIQQPRAENETLQQSSKFRRPKVTPRLNISRAAASSTSISGPVASPKEQASVNSFMISW